MLRSRTSWLPKLRPDQKPKLVADPMGRGRMLIPSPLLVAREISRVRKGRVITAATLRERLARRAGADRTCPLTTGIFLSIVAGAAEEQLAAGKRPVAPYWRVVAEGGILNPKLPPGAVRQAVHLRAEGHRVRKDRGRATWRVLAVPR
jgi:hypothetical protein